MKMYEKSMGLNKYTTKTFHGNLKKLTPCCMYILVYFFYELG